MAALIRLLGSLPLELSYARSTGIIPTRIYVLETIPHESLATKAAGSGPV